MPRRLATGVDPRLPGLVGALTLGILAVAAGWLTTTSLQQDFAAYYTAGTAAGRGLDPHLNHLPEPDGPWDGIAPFRHSRFLYPPLVAEVFRPLAALPFVWAKIIFTLASIAALLVGLGLVARDIAAATVETAAPSWPHWRSTLAKLVPVVCTLWLPVLLTLERGQIDLLVLAALAAAWHWRDRSLVAGAALALAAMGKPLVLGVLPLLIVGRRFRWAAATAGALLLLGGANVAVCGWAASKSYLHDVLPRAAHFGEGGTEDMLLPDGQTARASEDWEAGIARIDGKGRAWVPEVGTFARSASLPRLLAGDGGMTSFGVSVLAYVVFGAALAVGAWRAPRSGLWYWGGFMAAVAAAPISWAMSLVLGVPLFSWLWRRDAEGSRPRQRLPAVALATLGFAAGMLGPVGAAAWVVAGLALVAAAVVGMI